MSPPTRSTTTILLACSALLLLRAPAAAETGEESSCESLIEAFAKGEVALDLRYRFETVSDDAFAEDAEASTLRTTLGYATRPFLGASLHLEFENVTDLGAEDQHDNAGRNGLGNGVTDRPVIADPEITEVNQAYLRFALPGETRLDVGRREIDLDNQRFVGAVGWRQNHQSFDAVLVESEPVDGLTLRYAYVDRANRIFGDDKAMSTHLVNGAYASAVGSITGYAYLLDYDRSEDASLSTATYGARLDGARELGGAKLAYQAEYAVQRDHGDNPKEVDADYLLAQLGATVHDLSFAVGYELLSGAPGEGSFTTPLATLHKFNGWADKFLATPADGLRDLYASLSYGRGGVSLLAVYHQFDADGGSADYGSELDAQVTWKSPWKLVFGAKAALYDADSHSTDSEKLWLWTAIRLGGS